LTGYKPVKFTANKRPSAAICLWASAPTHSGPQARRWAPNAIPH